MPDRDFDKFCGPYVPLNIKTNDMLTLIYDPDLNLFSDDFGHIIHNIHSILSPSQVFIFKHHREHTMMLDSTGSYLVELLYSGEEDLM